VATLVFLKRKGGEGAFSSGNCQRERKRKRKQHSRRFFLHCCKGRGGKKKKGNGRRKGRGRAGKGGKEKKGPIHEKFSLSIHY